MVFGGLALAVVCVASSLALAKMGPRARRVLSSTPVENGARVETAKWTLTFPSAEWRRLNPGARRSLPSSKEDAFVHVPSGALLTVEGVVSEKGQYSTLALADAMVQQQRRTGTDLEVVSSSTFETCGVDGELRELRVTRNKRRFLFVEATYVGYWRGYSVSAWIEAQDAAEFAGELRKAATAFCPVDDVFSREWLRNFSISYHDERLRDVVLAREGETVEALNQRLLLLHTHGLKRLSRRELVRHVELMLALTRDADVTTCRNVWRWDLASLEARLATRPVDEMRDWYRIARHAQLAELEDTWADDAVARVAVRDAGDAPLPTALLEAARRNLLSDASPGALCTDATMLIEYALALPSDDRDALLRGVTWYED